MVMFLNFVYILITIHQGHMFRTVKNSDIQD